MTMKNEAMGLVTEIMELDVCLPIERCSDGESFCPIDKFTAKKIALIMAQKLQDTQAKQPVGYMSSYDYWEGVKNEIKAI